MIRTMRRTLPVLALLATIFAVAQTGLAEEAAEVVEAAEAVLITVPELTSADYPRIAGVNS
ncbi:MAG: hypothetical protein HOC70_16900, partial [Gammaproteobacteria bacterium]|nr:hypothetical protein [Gammaproteobacteria bacterium]